VHGLSPGGYVGVCVGGVVKGEKKEVLAIVTFLPFLLFLEGRGVFPLLINGGVESACG
jgi:hypothetical protein